MAQSAGISHVTLVPVPAGDWPWGQVNADSLPASVTPLTQPELGALREFSVRCFARARSVAMLNPATVLSSLRASRALSAGSRRRGNLLSDSAIWLGVRRRRRGHGLGLWNASAR